jgi:hypothetical protein
MRGESRAARRESGRTEYLCPSDRRTRNRMGRRQPIGASGRTVSKILSGRTDQGESAGFISAAKDGSEAFDHVLFCGPPSRQNDSRKHNRQRTWGHRDVGPCPRTAGDLAAILLIFRSTTFFYRRDPSVEQGQRRSPTPRWRIFNSIS